MLKEVKLVFFLCKCYTIFFVTGLKSNNQGDLTGTVSVISNAKIAILDLPLKAFFLIKDDLDYKMSVYDYSNYFFLI